MKVELGKPQEKAAAFAALLTLFVLAGWPELSTPPGWRLFLIYSLGAAAALWRGREPISIFRPTNLAFWWMVFGGVAMIWSFAMVLLSRFR